MRILQKISTLSIGFISFWVIIGLLGYDVENNLLIILLVLSTIIITFAIAKDTLGNLLSGLIIFIWKPFKQGDFLLINKEEISGILSNVGLMFSKLIDQNQNVIVIPNNLLLSNQISISQGKNYLITLYYRTSSFHNVDKIRKSLIHSATITNYIESKPRPIVLLHDLHGSEITLELTCFTTKYNQIDKIKSNIRTNFLKELKH
uniref:Small-conductance mechanosensitive channel-like protein n=1 Tax=uncultured marine thaumarchaeote AD1000_33_G09 TaxID=1455909 RepID=A0A075FQ08_9ARCH|nr:small-conductance mechanosensitive channel-like protein [uncultured marine thaumarchaeote AD1000_33_G09]